MNVKPSISSASGKRGQSPCRSCVLCEQFHQGLGEGGPSMPASLADATETKEPVCQAKTDLQA